MGRSRRTPRDHGLFEFVRVLSLRLFLGSSNCLHILMIIRPPVYWAVLYHTEDMNTHSWV
jgi:hypothetical protein